MSNILAGGSRDGLNGHEPLGFLDLFKLRLKSSLNLGFFDGKIGDVDLEFGADAPVIIIINN